MNQQTDQTDLWKQVVGFLTANTIPGGLFLLMWKGIDSLAKHFAEKRKAELEDMVDEKLKEERKAYDIHIATLRGEIAELRQLILRK